MVRDEMFELLEPAVRALGYELADLEFDPGMRQGQLRLFIDRAEGVTLADCERVSKQIGAVLDAEDPMPGRYVLEVSSPGANRTLRTREHYERFVGQRVRVQLKEPRDGRRRFTGRLMGLEKDDILIEVEEGPIQLPLAAVQKTRLVPDW